MYGSSTNPVRVLVSGGSEYVVTYAFLDNGSNGCFISNELLSQLGANGQDTTLKLKTMSGTSYTPSTAVQGIFVSSYFGESPLELPKCFTRDHIAVDTSQIPRADILSRWQHLQEATSRMPAFLPNTLVGLLIGTNCPKVLEPHKVIPSSGKGPFAVKHLHGWTISGPLYLSRSSESALHAVTSNRINVQDLKVKEVASPNDMVRLFDADFQDLETPEAPGKLGHSKEDVLFLEKADTTCEYHDGHFVLPLPFRHPHLNLPLNREQAAKRASWQRKKMLGNESYHQEYTAFIDNLLQRGYARRIPLDELPAEEGRLWYLPHHGVYHPTKHKLRVVFDCSARHHGTSLNDYLLQGPDLTNSLIGVLSRFRLEHIAFIGDIEAMFHQVRVIREHEDFLRFLWWPDGDLNEDLHEYAMRVHLFGAKSSPSIANYALRRTADMAEENGNVEAANTIRKHFYVDDCLKSVPTDKEAIDLIQNLKDACCLGGFRIAKFCCNSLRVLSSIDIEDRSKDLQIHSLDTVNLPTERALGVFWNVTDDVFGFSVNIKPKPLTRRGILSMTASVYDPLGFVAPYILRAKQLLRELCANKQLSWDDPVPLDFVPSWNDWLNQLPILESIQVDRCFKPPQFGEIASTEIHVFSDASTVGYGAVGYLRQVDISGTIHCSFLMSKSRLAPLKQTTIPRLELTAGTTAIRLGCLLHNELGIAIDKTIYYTDSTTVLSYLANRTRKFPIFVANRVQFILDYSKVTDWHYIDSKSNPADCASRGMNAHDIMNNPEWLKGPNFLWKSDMHSEAWTESSLPDMDNTACDDVTVASTTVKHEADNNATQKLISYFSDWNKLKMAVAVYQKVCSILYHRVHHSETECMISVRDLQAAEHSILKHVQLQHFAEEVVSLTSENAKLPKSSHILKLDDYVDRGLLHVGGRLSKSDFHDSAKHPIILPKKSHVTNLIVQDAHIKLGHAGRNHVLAHVRESYWIVHGNATVRKVISKCITCRKLRRPVSSQKWLIFRLKDAVTLHRSHTLVWTSLDPLSLNKDERSIKDMESCSLASQVVQYTSKSPHH